MRFLHYLQEEYVALGVGYFPGSDKAITFPIYKNPDSGDFKNLFKDNRIYNNNSNDRLLRCIIDLKNKNIFVWIALLGVHIEGFNALKKSGDIKLEHDSAYNLFCGAPRIRRGSTKFDSGDECLSFVQYMRYYGLSGTYDYTVLDTKSLESKTKWLQKYYRGIVIGRDSSGLPTLISV